MRINSSIRQEARRVGKKFAVSFQEVGCLQCLQLNASSESSDHKLRHLVHVVDVVHRVVASATS